jgi:hypothetical protein
MEPAVLEEAASLTRATKIDWLTGVKLYHDIQECLATLLALEAS